MALVPTVQTGTGWWAFIKIGGYFLSGAAAYFLASMLPEQEILRRKGKRQENRGGTLGDSLFRVPDGTLKTTHQEDMDNFLTISFLVCLAAAILIRPLAIINAIRNYGFLLNKQAAEGREPAGE